MTYAANSAKDSVRSEMLVILKPRIRVTDWTVYSGSVYSSSFSRGFVYAVSVNGVALTEGASASLSAGQFFYDATNEILYVRKSSGTPSGSDWIVVTFELHLSTHEMYFNRIPTDDTSSVVRYHGVIQQPPTISRRSTDLIFGFAPVESTQVVCNNDPELFQELVNEASFNEIDVSIYHVLGDVDTANIEKLFTGLGGGVSFSDSSITFSILDKTYLFEKPMDNSGATLTYPDSTGTDGTSPDPSFAGKVIRSFYGNWRGVRAVCMKFDSDSPGTSDNREWAFCTRQFGTPVELYNLFLIKDGSTSYPLTVTTHYTNGNLNSTTYGITLVNNVEGLLGCATIDPTNDFVIASSIDGPDITPTISGSPAGDFENPISILYHILVDRLGLTSGEINEASFATAAASTPITASVAIPDSPDSEMPTYKDVITRLLATSLARAYFDSNGEFTVSLVGLASDPADLEITDDDIINPSFDCSYSDLAEVYFYNGPVDYALRRVKADVLAGVAGPCSFMQNEFQSWGSANYEANQYLHQSGRTVSLDNYCGEDSGTAADNFAALLAQMIGERRLMLSVFLKRRGFDLEIGQTVSVSRKKLPGFEFDGETEHSRSFVISEIRKEIGGVYLVLDDQKGIEDNAGDW